MQLYIIQGIVYGFAAAVQPGPFQTYLISQTLSRGWKRTLPATLAPLISDAPIITLCLLVLSQVPAWLQRFLYVVGGLFVLYLAYGAHKSWKNFIPDISSSKQRFSKGYQSRADQYIKPQSLYLLDFGHRPNPFDGLARDTCQRDSISRWFLYVHDIQLKYNHSGIWRCKTVRAKSESRLAGSFCNRPILF